MKVEDVIEEFERLQKRDSQGYSIHELASAWGVGVESARRRLRELAVAGVLRSARRSVTRIDGLKSMQPVYWIEKPQPHPKAAKGKKS